MLNKPNSSNARAKHTGAFASDTITSITQKRRALAASQEWVVEKIFPAGAMHLIGGPSGVGKTTWLFQMLYDWEQGLPIFGEYQSNPLPWVYVSCDRSIREMQQTLARIGLADWEFEAYALEELIYNRQTKLCDPPDFTVHILNKFKHAKLIVVEGLQAVMPDHSKARSQNKNELLWALNQRFVLSGENRTVIATTHNPKVSQMASGTNDERSKFLGSQGFIGSCSTMIGFDKDPAPGIDERVVKIMGRNFKDISLRYSIDENGKFVPEVVDQVPIETDEDRELRFLTWLQSSSSVNSREAKKYWEDRLQGAMRTFERLLAKLKADGKVKSAPASSDTRDGVIYTYIPPKIN